MAMANSREEILSDIASSLKKNHETKPDATAGTLAAVQPAIDIDLIDEFIKNAQSASVTVRRLASVNAIAEFLNMLSPREEVHSLALAPELQPIAQFLSGIQLCEAVDADWGLVIADAGIAETGSVVFNSHDCPSNLLFLVEHLYVVVDAKDIYAYQEDIWRELQSELEGPFPRSIHMVTGPSRTADVEQTIQLGAHGPKSVDYLLI